MAANTRSSLGASRSDAASSVRSATSATAGEWVGAGASILISVAAAGSEARVRYWADSVGSQRCAGELSVSELDADQKEYVRRRFNSVAHRTTDRGRSGIAMIGPFSRRPATPQLYRGGATSVQRRPFGRQGFTPAPSPRYVALTLGLAASSSLGPLSASSPVSRT